MPSAQWVNVYGNIEILMEEFFIPPIEDWHWDLIMLMGLPFVPIT
jgi:hypothetical protein